MVCAEHHRSFHLYIWMVWELRQEDLRKGQRAELQLLGSPRALCAETTQAFQSSSSSNVPEFLDLRGGYVSGLKGTFCRLRGAEDARRTARRGVREAGAPGPGERGGGAGAGTAGKAFVHRMLAAVGLFAGNGRVLAWCCAFLAGRRWAFNTSASTSTNIINAARAATAIPLISLGADLHDDGSARFWWGDCPGKWRVFASAGCGYFMRIYGGERTGWDVPMRGPPIATSRRVRTYCALPTKSTVAWRGAPSFPVVHVPSQKKKLPRPPPPIRRRGRGLVEVVIQLQKVFRNALKPGKMPRKDPGDQFGGGSNLRSVSGILLPPTSWRGERWERARGGGLKPWASYDLHCERPPTLFLFLLDLGNVTQADGSADTHIDTPPTTGSPPVRSQATQQRERECEHGEQREQEEQDEREPGRSGGSAVKRGGEVVGMGWWDGVEVDRRVASALRYADAAPTARVEYTHAAAITSRVDSRTPACAGAGAASELLEMHAVTSGGTGRPGRVSAPRRRSLFRASRPRRRRRRCRRIVDTHIPPLPPLPPMPTLPSPPPRPYPLTRARPRARHRFRERLNIRVPPPDRRPALKRPSSGSTSGVSGLGAEIRTRPHFCFHVVVDVQRECELESYAVFERVRITLSSCVPRNTRTRKRRRMEDIARQDSVTVFSLLRHRLLPPPPPSSPSSATVFFLLRFLIYLRPLRRARRRFLGESVPARAHAAGVGAGHGDCALAAGPPLTSSPMSSLLSEDCLWTRTCDKTDHKYQSHNVATAILRSQQYGCHRRSPSLSNNAQLDAHLKGLDTSSSYP
ncbi:hypothetical protein B0H16DRAFT_1693867 [Mycena metata]|uniref:Uncharacterized protein n=1 Tax=Mycena metata TaxID=1033252 RepID=A0AAD7II38_9AGAR|nr:hypothetical protein B0H16DRAFT_1693867 [Mycena metata]